MENAQCDEGHDQNFKRDVMQGRDQGVTKVRDQGDVIKGRDQGDAIKVRDQGDVIKGT